MPQMSREQEKAMFAKRNQGNPRSSISPQMQDAISVIALQKQKKESDIEMKVARQKNVPEFTKNKVLTEQQIKLLQRRLNDKKIKEEDIFGDDFDKSKLITAEQTTKGLNWLDDKRRTPKGKERLNNPFGAREEEILDNFDHFELKEFFDSGNQFVSFKIPLWEVVSKDGQSFEYHSQGGKVNITG